MILPRPPDGGKQNNAAVRFRGRHRKTTFGENGKEKADVHRNNEHRIVAPTIQIRSLAACGPLRACRPETLLRKQNLPKEMTK